MNAEMFIVKVTLLLQTKPPEKKKGEKQMEMQDLISLKVPILFIVKLTFDWNCKADQGLL